MIARIKSVRWTLLFGIAAGLAMSMLTPMAWIDALFPVVTMQAQVASKTPTEVMVSLSGTKNRECRYDGITAYSQMGTLLKELNIDRVDRPATDSTHPKGTFDFGTWRIWPTTGTKLVALYVSYDCNGRHVHVRAAEVAL